MLLSALERRQSLPPITDDFWYRPVWAHAGSTEVSPETAKSLSAWYNALTIVAGTLGSLPLKLYRRVGEGREEARDDPRYWMLWREPNEWQTAFEWREMGQGHLMARGNFYNRKLRDRIGRTQALVPLHPGRVTPEVRDGRLRYRFETSSGPEIIPAEDMLHIRGLGSNGITGDSVVALARQSLGYALGLEEHGSQLMNNQARPGGALQTDQVLKPETKDQLARTFDEKFVGGGIGRTAVFDAGLKWQQIGFSAEDAQFIESREFQVREIARWTNMPPHLLKDMADATFSNIEEQAIEFVVHTIRPWTTRWEQRLDCTLLSPDEQQDMFFKFSLEGLLQGNSQAQAEFFTALFQLGALSPNEIRGKLEMNPVEGGDERFVQVNLMPLSRASDPFGAMDESTARAIAGLEERTRIAPSFEDRSIRSLDRRRRLMEIHRALLTDGAGRLVRREIQDLRRLLDAVDEGDVEEFLRRVGVFAEGLPDTVRAVLGPLLAAYIELVAEVAAGEADVEAFTEPMENFRDAYIESSVQGHTSATVNKIRRTALETQGEPWPQLRAMFDRWEESRAQEMGLREAVTAGAAVARTMYGAAGLATVWVAFGENCPYCKRLDGRVVSPGDKFLEAGEKVDPEDGETEPLIVKRAVGHPQAHAGCDCGVRARRL